MIYPKEAIARVLDYAVLNPTATIQDIVDGAVYANKHRLVSVCVSSANVKFAALYHKNVSAVVGFPHGNQSEEAKLIEAQRAIEDGAKELDVVVNYGRYLGGNRTIIETELGPICEMAVENFVVVKAILETCYYTPEQIRDACLDCQEAGVEFVKTSTGFGHGPATPEAVKIMIDTVRDTGVGVKASGGIKTYEDAAKYLDLGCTRLGASRFLEICHE